MKLYAIYKDGELYQASYDQNVPFYGTLKGAKAAIRSQTNRRFFCHLKFASSKDEQDFLELEKQRYTIKEFQLGEGRIINE